MSPRGGGAARHAAPALPPCPGLVRRRDSRSQGQRRACPSRGFPHGPRQLQPRRGAAGAQRCRRSVPALRRDSDAPPAERGPFTPRRIKVSLRKKTPPTPAPAGAAAPRCPPGRRTAPALPVAYRPCSAGDPRPSPSAPPAPRGRLLRAVAARAAPGAAARRRRPCPGDACEPRAALGTGRAAPWHFGTHFTRNSCISLVLQPGRHDVKM